LRTGNILIAVLLFLTACDGDDRDASVQPSPEPPAPQVAIFGDSIVQAMAGSNNPVAPFDRALNAGISGQTTEEIADRVTAAAPIVFLEGGTNDLTRNLPLDEIVSNYRRMLDKLTGVRVVIIGIPPVDEGLFSVRRVLLISNAKIAQINAQLAHLCSQYSNCQTATAAMQFNMADKTLDGIHLKPETYTAWTIVLAQYLADPSIPDVDLQRQPSCFSSCAQPGPEGGCLATIGWQG
jgi:lysophospholipase L1-like esterase